MAAPSKAFHIIFIYLFAGKAVSTQITVMVKNGVRGVCSLLLPVPEGQNNNNNNKKTVKQKSNSTPAIQKLTFPFPPEFSYSQWKLFIWRKKNCLNKRKRQKVSHQLTFIFLQGSRVEETGVESTSLTSEDCRGSFLVQSSNMDGAKSFCTAVCRPQSSQNIILCVIVVFYELVTQGYCWVSRSYTRCVHFLDRSIVFSGDFTFPELFSFSEVTTFAVSECLLSTWLTFSLRSPSAEFRPLQYSNEGTILTFSNWMFRYY